MTTDAQIQGQLARDGLQESKTLLRQSRAVAAYFEACRLSHLGQATDQQCVTAHHQATAAGINPYALIGIASLAYQASREGIAGHIREMDTHGVDES